MEGGSVAFRRRNFFDAPVISTEKTFRFVIPEVTPVWSSESVTVTLPPWPQLPVAPLIAERSVAASPPIVRTESSMRTTAVMERVVEVALVTGA